MTPEQDTMTFEDLSSLYRVESKSTQLSEVRKDLYTALIKMQAEALKAYETLLSEDPDSIVCEGSNERKKKINYYVGKVVELRMGKIAAQALRGAVGADNIIDKMTSEEREYYEEVVSASKKHRSKVVKNRDKRKYTLPDISPAKQPYVAKMVAKEPVAEKPVMKEAVMETAEEIVCSEMTIEEPIEPDEPEDVLIRVLDDLPKFSGPDCDYELKKEDIVKMPVILANALISRQKAVVIRPTP